MLHDVKIDLARIAQRRSVGNQLRHALPQRYGDRAPMWRLLPSAPLESVCMNVCQRYELGLARSALAACGTGT